LVRSNIANPSKNRQNPVLPLNLMSLISAHKLLESLMMLESGLDPLAKGLRKNKINMIVKAFGLFIVPNFLKINLPIYNIPLLQFLSIYKSARWSFHQLECTSLLVRFYWLVHGALTLNQKCCWVWEPRSNRYIKAVVGRCRSGFPSKAGYPTIKSFSEIKNKLLDRCYLKKYLAKRNPMNAIFARG